MNGKKMCNEFWHNMVYIQNEKFMNKAVLNWKVAMLYFQGVLNICFWSIRRYYNIMYTYLIWYIHKQSSLPSKSSHAFVSSVCLILYWSICRYHNTADISCIIPLQHQGILRSRVFVKHIVTIVKSRKKEGRNFNVQFRLL